MNDQERELLLEAATTAFRERDREGRLIPSPAWWDLAPEEKDELFRLQVVTRRMEQAFTGVTGTARAVLERILS